MSRHVEGHLLRLAVERGLVDRASIDSLEVAQEVDREPERGWGPRVEALLNAGLLDEEALIGLLLEMAERAALPWSGLTERAVRSPSSGSARSGHDGDGSGQRTAAAGSGDGSSDGSGDGSGSGSDDETTSGVTTRSLDGSRQEGVSSSHSPFPSDWTRYRVLERLGIGGMGEVFKAYDPVLKRFVALKLMREDDPVLLERFEREARAQARVDHPNVCEVYEVGAVEGRPYIAMRYIEGTTLHGHGAELGPEAAARLMRDVALAVHAAHRQGLIHRDLKPGNILVERDEDGELVPYVVDFGLARDLDTAGLTVTGAVSGTPAYMSPEQALGEAQRLDRRSDLYSLGAVFYELLCGQRPHVGTTDMAALLKIVSEDVVPLRRISSRVPEDLATIVMACLQREPDRRYDSARALAEDLDRFLDGEPIQARPPSATYLVRKWVRKNRALAATIGLALVVALLQTGTIVHSRWQASMRARLAQRFGSAAKEIEDTMRLAALLPRQDTTPFRALVERSMDGIRGEMQRLGRVSQGPGLYALGRGAMALGRYATARDYLEQALEAGESGPEVHSALGQVLALQHREARAEADRIADPELRRIRQEELSRTLMASALSELRLALDGREQASAFERSLIAFYEGWYDGAIATARSLYQEQPWRFEARRLEAEILLTRAAEAINQTDYDAARALLEQAGAVHREVLEVARSAGEIHLDECRRRTKLLDIDLLTGVIGNGSGSDQRLQDALEPCRNAIEVEPHLAQAEEQEAEIYVIWAKHRIQSGEDPHQALAGAAAAAERAISLQPESEPAYEMEGWAAELQARWLNRRGLDPSEAIDRATTALEMALKLNPASAEAYNHLSKALYTRSRFLAARGADSRPTIREMISCCRQAISVYPGYGAGYSNLGSAQVALAEQEISIGEDPGPTLVAAVESFDHAIEVQPNRSSHHNNRGNAFLTLAEYLIQTGGDPFDALGSAALSYQDAARLRPGYAITQFNIGLCSRYRAEALLRRGEDPTTACEKAVAEMSRGLELNPEDSDFLLETARAEVIAGRWQLAHHQDPTRWLARAREAVAAGLGLNASDARLHATAAAAWHWHATWLHDAGRDPLPAIRSGIASADRALGINPTLAEALAIRGALLLLQAEVEPVAGRASRLAAQGRSQLEQAVSQRGALDPQLERLLEASGQ